MLVVGIAGAGDPELRARPTHELVELGLASAIQVVADAELQLEAAFSRLQPGIVVVGGTGSIALARDAHGTIHRSGGLGFRFSDEGGGYDIGRAAVQAVLQAADGRGPQTILTDLLYLETENPRRE